MSIIEIATADKFKKYTDEETFAKIVEYPSVSKMWENCLKEYSKLNAIEDNGISYTYADIEKSAAKMRAEILKVTDGGKKRIAILAPNSYSFVAGFIAIVTTGCAAIILPSHLDERSVFGCCMKYGASALIYSKESEEKTSIAATKLKTILISEEYESEAKAIDVNPEDECVLMFTSGTTGKSKAAILNNRAVMMGTVNGCYGYKDVFNQKYILVLPLSHVFGLIRNLMTSLYTGSDLLICRDNKNMFRDIAMFKPSILVAVPALVEMALTLSRQFNKNMFGSDMKTIICGAAAVAPYLIEECDKYGIRVCPGYGLTESANLVSGNPEGLTKNESVGIPYPHQKFRIENGELWIKGDNMMTGYADDDAENPYEDGWFKTGDLVKFDEDGFLYITGRCKEIIVLSNGENVSPQELEAAFNRLSFIQDSQVYEDVLESGEHILALEVVPRRTELKNIPSEEQEDFIIEELKKVNREALPHQRVSKIIVRDSDFERSPSMKIVRYKKC